MDRKLQYNRNGIPINLNISLALLEVIGTGDPFEGEKYDPQFETIINAPTPTEEEG